MEYRSKKQFAIVNTTFDLVSIHFVCFLLWNVAVTLWPTTLLLSHCNACTTERTIIKNNDHSFCVLAFVPVDMQQIYNVSSVNWVCTMIVLDEKCPLEIFYFVSKFNILLVTVHEKKNRKSITNGMAHKCVMQNKRITMVSITRVCNISITGTDENYHYHSYILL